MSPVPGRHVDDEVLGLVPVHVGEELLERLVQHRAPPDDRLVLAGEEAHRDEAHAVGLGRDDHVVDHDRRLVDAEHARHREAPHVGVDRGDVLAPLRERDREVRGDRRLARRRPCPTRSRARACAESVNGLTRVGLAVGARRCCVAQAVPRERLRAPRRS